GLCLGWGYQRALREVFPSLGRAELQDALGVAAEDALAPLALEALVHEREPAVRRPPRVVGGEEDVCGAVEVERQRQRRRVVRHRVGVEAAQVPGGWLGQGLVAAPRGRVLE